VVVETAIDASLGLAATKTDNKNVTMIVKLAMRTSALSLSTAPASVIRLLQSAITSASNVTSIMTPIVKPALSTKLPAVPTMPELQANAQPHAVPPLKTLSHALSGPMVTIIPVTPSIKPAPAYQTVLYSVPVLVHQPITPLLPPENVINSATVLTARPVSVALKANGAPGEHAASLAEPDQ
jgi:hypothetical protein